MNCLIKRHTNIDELNAKLSTTAQALGLRGFPALRNTNIYRWHLLYEEQRDDPGSVLNEVPIFETWRPAERFALDTTIQQTVLAELRSWVAAEIMQNPGL